ncbi:TPA: phage tail protein [Serratia marcescens]|nr:MULTISPECIES: phage tail protein [Serratia]EHT9831246.1 phage tail protein [Serratia marcescens]EMB7753718.1 phage tail protein [Serratia marcescens]MDP8629203.1 phage tail protein [Serratia marcescens]MDP8762346.1 phage tail protein [Serratia marcescens]HBH7057058.1 phage tail protein [Serratia marcescens]
MPAGTLTLTNNSAVVKGTGTAFNTELKAGDFIVSVVGGVTYTLPVKTVDSATQATLIKAYDGPTQAGAAWYAVPRDAMNTITAQLAAETAKALRGLNLDKNNWQQVFSGTGNITVTLPDGSTYTGPAWNSFTSALNLKADKTELDKKADKSSLGSLASKNSITRSELNNELVRNLFASGARSKNDGGAGVWTFDNTPWGFDTQYGIAIQVNNRTDTSNAAGDGIWQHYLALGTNGEILYVLNINGQYAAHKMWSTKNTTVDGNGFLKKASPIVKLFRDGTCELNDESQGVTTERVSEGVYRVSGTLGFNADAQWGGPDGGIEVPLDRNKQPLIWVDYEVEPTGDLLIKTYHRTHTAAPPFARNDVQGYDEGMPIDIPTGRWIDLRVEMPVKKEINK